MPARMHNTGISSGESQKAIRGANRENFEIVIPARAIRAPIDHVWIHTVSRRDSPLLMHLLFPKLVLTGCKANQRYVTCTKIADPILQVSPDTERGGTRLDEEDAWRAVIDLLNPQNLTNDPYADTTAASAFVQTSQNCNLIAQGFFPSRNMVPTEAELLRAEKARDSRYRQLAQRATQLAATSTKQLQEYLLINPDVHDAMDALGMSADWHQAKKIMVQCPNCGDQIASGIAFHRSSSEVLCVIDAKRAFKAGVIDMEKYQQMKEFSSAVSGA